MTEQKNKLVNILEGDKDEKPVLKLTPLPKRVVNPRTQEDYWTLMRILECGGLKWRDRTLPTSFNAWNIQGGFQSGYNKEETCIGVGAGSGLGSRKEFGYASKEFYLKKGCKIITPQEFYDAQEPPITTERIKEVNNWFGNRGGI